MTAFPLLMTPVTYDNRHIQITNFFMLSTLFISMCHKICRKQHKTTTTTAAAAATATHNNNNNNNNNRKENNFICMLFITSNHILSDPNLLIQ
jgi:hypothetical protein